MTTGDRVKTPCGLGTILTQEFSKGSLAERYSVKLDDCPEEFQESHNQNGGVYFWKSEIEVVNETNQR